MVQIFGQHPLAERVGRTVCRMEVGGVNVLKTGPLELESRFHDDLQEILFPAVNITEESVTGYSGVSVSQLSSK